jgi:hypothetical protein
MRAITKRGGPRLTVREPNSPQTSIQIRIVMKTVFFMQAQTSKRCLAGRSAGDGLLPREKDPIDGERLSGYFAVIAAWAGEKDLALQQLDAAISLPGAAQITS